jgi:hypothetical protein
MLVVLLDTDLQFQTFLIHHQSPFLTADAFVTHENVLFFAPSCRDEVYRSLVETSASSTDPFVGMAMKAAEEEWMVSTVSQQGGIQLAVTSGVLNANAIQNRSIRLGFPSLLEVPASSGVHNIPVIRPTRFRPHWHHCELFIRILTDGTLPLASGKKALLPTFDLLRVLQDESFLEIEKSARADRDIYRQRALAEAWGVTYYLMRTQQPKLLDFYRRLEKLPTSGSTRAEEIETAFAEAFGLVDVNKPRKVDRQLLREFQRSMVEYMKHEFLPELRDWQRS